MKEGQDVERGCDDGMPLGPSIPAAPPPSAPVPHPAQCWGAGRHFRLTLWLRTPGPRAFRQRWWAGVRGGGRGRGLCSAGFLSAGEAWAVQGGRTLQCGGGGRTWSLAARGPPSSPVTLLLRALSFVGYNQVLSHRNCDRQGLTGSLLVLLCSHPSY